MSDKNANFEKSFEQLEKIITRLESGDCALEESIALFEEGMKHTKNCKDALDNAKQKIITLTNELLEEEQ